MRYCFSLGSNLGDRYFYMKEMITFLKTLLYGDVKISSLMETEPLEVNNSQLPYLNQIISGCSEILPNEMLIKCQQEEERLGRTGKGMMLSRTADIDIIFIDDQVIQSESLSVPHHAICKRRFIIEGLVETDIKWRHPLLQKSINELHLKMSDELNKQKIRRIK